MNDQFKAILERAQIHQKNTIAKNSLSTYNEYLKLYEKIMQILNTDPYDITIEKMMVFIQKAKDDGYEYDSLKCAIASLSYYFRANNLDNLTQDIQFVNFHKGILRDMKGRRNPNRKEPWKPEFFDMYLQAYDLNQLYNTKFLFYMVISYYGFLRISELQNLKTEDITLDEENHRLKLHIRFSKTDQTGVGSDIFIYENDKNYSPYKLYKMLNKNFENNEYIVDLTGSQLRHHLKIILKHIGLNDTEYSWHSFRRGGAHQASLNGVPDCEIKKHGRWLSEAYIRYVDVNPEKAGLNITNKI